MARVPDFYLTTAGEFPPLTAPRACTAIGRLRDNVRDDYMLVEVEPPISGTECGLAEREVVTQLLLASKWRGLTLFPVAEWPMPVYVMVAVDPAIVNARSFRSDQVRMIAWGTLHRTIEDAAKRAKELERWDRSERR